MKGLYVYKNPYLFPISQGFTIPLPVDSDNSKPVLLSALELGEKNREIPLLYAFGANRFHLNFKPKETIIVQVTYRQEAPAHNARYILTTTQSWESPLLQGNYFIHPHGVQITFSNYALEDINDNDKSSIGFKRIHFMPEHDWELNWELL